MIDCLQITDITVLQNLINLKSLNICDCDFITDITALQHLTNLRIIR